MRKIILILFVLMSSKLFAQVDSVTFNLPLENGSVHYSKIILIDSTLKYELFDRSKLWVAENYKSAKDVIQYESKDAGEILCKGLFNVVFVGKRMLGQSLKYVTYCAVKLSVKDNKAKIEVYDIRYEYDYYISNTLYTSKSTPEDYKSKDMMGSARRENTQKLLDLTNDEIQSLITSFESAIKKKSAKSSDW